MPLPRRSLTTVVATAGIGLAAAMLGPAASAHGTPQPVTIASGLVTPFQLDVGHRGQVYTGQSFAGLLTKVRPDGSTKLLTAEQGSVTGVASREWGVAFTYASSDEEHPETALKWRAPNGRVTTIASLSTYEATHNPDASNTYGFLGLSPACAEQVPPEIGGEPYPGQVDSNPYAVANAPGGGWFVADAGGNDILYVSPHGWVKTVAVLPPQPITVTQEMADGLGLPGCTVGASYAFEPVPTDVEVGHHGKLVVSLLPGGPEDASLGARGSVVEVGRSGWVRVLGTGFLGTTNVAIGSCGRIYVAELFANRISVLRHGHVRTFADTVSPAGVEVHGGWLYASVNVFDDGAVVRYRL